MAVYECLNCSKKFANKSNYNRHIIKKKSCGTLPINDNITIDGDDDDNDNVSVGDNADIKMLESKFDDKIIKKSLNECKCPYCWKEYSRKDSVIFHIKKNCKVAKEIEKEKLFIFTQLKEINEKNQKIIHVENKQKTLEEENIKIKKETRELIKAVNKLEKELQNRKNIVLNNNTVNNNGNTINNNQQNNQQNILLIDYNKEDYDLFSKDEILSIMRRGFQASVELTKVVHFNPRFPQFHNVYIPKINEKYGMIYVDDDWKLIEKNELVEDIYDNKRDYIIQNFDNFIDQIDEKKIISLRRWLGKNDNDDESIINTKEDIKKLLFEKRALPMQMKKIWTKNNKIKIMDSNKKYAIMPKITIRELSNNDSDDSNSEKINVVKQNIAKKILKINNKC